MGLKQLFGEPVIGEIIWCYFESAKIQNKIEQFAQNFFSENS